MVLSRQHKRQHRKQEGLAAHLSTQSWRPGARVCVCVCVRAQGTHDYLHVCVLWQWGVRVGEIFKLVYDYSLTTSPRFAKVLGWGRGGVATKTKWRTEVRRHPHLPAEIFSVCQDFLNACLSRYR